MTQLLTVEELLEVAAGVLPEVLVRDMGLLASAAERPAMSVFGVEAYPTLVEKVSALMHSLARNPPLADGNKRLAWAAARVTCLLNGCDLTYESVDEAEAFVLGVAAGELDMPEIGGWIRQHLKAEV